MTKSNILFALTVFIMFFTLISANDADYSNPNSWGGDCQTGTSQSPININTKTLNFCPNINKSFKYLCVATPFVGSGQSFTVQAPQAGYIGIKDGVGNGPNIRLYQTAQIHFHAPSEHTINGKSYPLEIHHFFTALSNEDGTNITLTSQFVNYSTSTYSNTNVYAAVLGYLYYPSDDANALDFNIHTDANGTAQMNRKELFGCTSSRFWYHYRGSATTPPCTEKVDWFVYREPLPIKRSNYEAIKASINHG
jgi:carbonic anhydrase